MIGQKKKASQVEELRVKNDREVTGERAIAALLQAASDDEGLLVRVRSAKTAAELVKIGAEVGYQFTVADLQAAKVKAHQLHQAMQEIYKLFEDRSLAGELQTAESPDRIVEIGASKGYKFTTRDLQVFLVNAAARQPVAEEGDEFDDYELTDEELEMVSGGRLRMWAMALASFWHPDGIVIPVDDLATTDVVENQYTEWHLDLSGLNFFERLARREDIALDILGSEVIQVDDFSQLAEGQEYQVSFVQENGDIEMQNIVFDGFLEVFDPNNYDSNEYEVVT